MQGKTATTTAAALCHLLSPPSLISVSYHEVAIFVHLVMVPYHGCSTRLWIRHPARVGRFFKRFFVDIAGRCVFGNFSVFRKSTHFVCFVTLKTCFEENWLRESSRGVCWLACYAVCPSSCWPLCWYLFYILNFTSWLLYLLSPPTVPVLWSLSSPLSAHVLSLSSLCLMSICTLMSLSLLYFSRLYLISFCRLLLSLSLDEICISSLYLYLALYRIYL